LLPFPRTTALMASVTGLLLVAPPALAADRGESTPLDLPTTDGQAAASSGGGSLLRTLVGLAIVLAVIYGLYWVLKQVKASREGTASGQGLETLATVPLGTGRSVHLVRAGTEIVLLGVSEHAVVPIRTYSEDEALDAGLLAGPGLPAPAADTTVRPPSAAVVLRDALARLQQRTVRG
jgi:flagellar protein FliO/FliZ